MPVLGHCLFELTSIESSLPPFLREYRPTLVEVEKIQGNDTDASS